MTCPLCNIQNYFYKNSLFFLIFVDEIPGYIRLITNRHIKEISDLEDNEAVEIILAIKKIEKILLKHSKADKINVASLGNMVPHLHFHIIPRYKNDPWWPGATFCEKIREFEYPQINLEKIKEEIIKSLG